MDMFSNQGLTNDEQFQSKRKRRSYSTSSCSENANSDEPSSASNSSSTDDIDSERKSHNKIEKRRRDKMNSFITHLSQMIPTYTSKRSNKRDKITILRMAVQYLRSIRVSRLLFSPKRNLRHSFISDQELKKLILQISEGFLFVVNCDSLRILFISQSASQILDCNHNDLTGCSLYDVIHPQDIKKLKEQISCVDLNPRHQVTSSNCPVRDLNVEMPSEQLGIHSGNRRSFFFRIRSDAANKFTGSAATNEWVLRNNGSLEPIGYITIHCVGYFKFCNPDIKTTRVDAVEDSTLITTFVAIGSVVDTSATQIYQPNRLPVMFVSKYAADGKILFVDLSITLVTGYLPQDILGTNIYDYIHPDDANDFAVIHQSMWEYPNSTSFNNFRFRTKSGNYIPVQSQWGTLHNPWTKEIEYYYCKNTVQWVREHKLNMEKVTENEAPHLVENDDPFIPAQKMSHNHMGLNLQNSATTYEKTIGDNDASMDMVFKLLEHHTNILN